MRWDPRRSTPDVIDQRGGGGGGGGLPIGGRAAGGGLGLVGILVVIAFQVLGGGSGAAFGVDQPFGSVPGAAEGGQPIPASQDPDRNLRDFSAYVFTDVQDRWEKSFAADGKRYERAKLVLFSDAVSTGGCGNASSDVGPFYCPGDRRVYLDLSFYKAMERQLNAPGDFAWAYVIAHEMGHHVQQQLGTDDRVSALRRDDPASGNELSVRQELQADCYAGVWAHEVYSAGQLDDGDVDEAFTAAEAVGDDRLQQAAGQRVNRDSFTHGSSAQRRSWFDRGRADGDPAACDTFTPDSV